MPVVRNGEPGDLDQVESIQHASPEAAQWRVADYLEHDLRVAVEDGQVVGFLAARPVAADEYELLNIAVTPEFRRKGVARGLIQALLTDTGGTLFLEVRESNGAARNLYKSMGFQEVSIRREYYNQPPETAIVMMFHSC
jgi:ribosomal-protein-alanine N-acetyltransferase